MLPEKTCGSNAAVVFGCLSRSFRWQVLHEFQQVQRLYLRVARALVAPTFFDFANEGVRLFGCYYRPCISVHGPGALAYTDPASCFLFSGTGSAHVKLSSVLCLRVRVR